MYSVLGRCVVVVVGGSYGVVCVSLWAGLGGLTTVILGLRF